MSERPQDYGVTVDDLLELVDRLRLEVERLSGVRTVNRPVDKALALAELLESMAEEVETIDTGQPEKYVARRLLLEAAGAARGAARNLDRLERPST